MRCGNRASGLHRNVMVPMLLKSGHVVVGLDSHLYERCTFAAGGDIVDVPHIRKDVRDVDVGGARGARCHHPSGGSVQRSFGQFPSRCHLRD